MIFKKDKFISIATKAILILAIFVVWILIWRLYEKINNSSSDNLILECTSCNDTYWILNITEVSPLWIKWEITAWDLRIVAWDQSVSWKDTNFQLSTTDVYRSLKFVAPEWAKFFASKYWKKLYPISDEKSLEKISVKNIIFFKDLNEAKRYWFENK